MRHHYYTPLTLPADLRDNPGRPRAVNGLDLNEDGQFALLREFAWREELLAIPPEAAAGAFGYHNGSFEAGDAEYLYNMIRRFRPARMIEIGGGNSTLMAQLAIRRNREEDPAYSCDHVCIEPFERPDLESSGARMIRERAEDCPDSVFADLGANDILFIDSSHVVRPQGDVVFEYLRLLGTLRPGVIVHVHDIFTPRDYPATWILDDRRMWAEQYLLEAFLCFNRRFEVIGALNWLYRNHGDRLGDACPVLMRERGRNPGSFWFRRVS